MESLNKMIEKHPEASKRVAFFALFYVISFGIFYLVNTLVYVLTPSFFVLMEITSTPPLLGSKIELNILGLILPLIVSIIFSLFAFRFYAPNEDKRFRFSLWLLAATLVIVTLFSILTGYQLKPVYSNGNGGPNLPSFFIVPAFAMIWVALDIKKIGLLLSYVFGFLVGFISDFEGIRYFTKVTIFGGHGFLDIDFIIPMMMFVSYLLTFKYAPRYYGK